jgi:beta-glucosidase
LGTIGGSEDRAAALEAARESIVLAENDNNLLPLSTDRQKRILTAGPSCDSLTYMTGGWTINWQGSPTDTLFQFGTTVVEGIRNHISGTDVQLTEKRGCDINGDSDPYEFDDVVNSARNADVVILCVGETHYTELSGNIDGEDQENKKTSPPRIFKQYIYVFSLRHLAARRSEKLD